VSVRASVGFVGRGEDIFLGQALFLDAEGGISVEDRKDHC